MGWHYVEPKHFLDNGKVDRKAEMDAVYNWDSEYSTATVLDSFQHRDDYYAAVKLLNKFTGEEKVIGIFADTSKVAGFSYKELLENEGPYKYDCPPRIINLLSPTRNKKANKWREACLLKAMRRQMFRMPEGTVIEFRDRYGNTRHATKISAPTKKRPDRTVWFDGRGNIPSKDLPGNARVVFRPREKKTEA